MILRILGLVRMAFSQEVVSWGLWHEDAKGSLEGNLWERGLVHVPQPWVSSALSRGTVGGKEAFHA